MNRERNLFSRSEMLEMNIEILNKRGVTLKDIALIAFQQQSKWNDDISYPECEKSVEKILSLRDVFHIVQLGAEIDRLTEEEQFSKEEYAICNEYSFINPKIGI